MRKQGYYWVMFDGEWQVGLWTYNVALKNHFWFMSTALDCTFFTDKGLQKINETRLLDPQESIPF